MKGKFVVILILLALLIFTVYKMVKYETSLRQEKIITLYVEDETKPLMENMPLEQLEQAAANAQYYFKTGSTYFESLQTKLENNEKVLFWENIFLKGVNLGVAVPGKFPAEFSLTFDDYLRWLKMIGEMNSNVIRTYTILPPEFYKALSYYNLYNSNRPVYIMLGVWATIPEDGNYFNPKYIREFQKEIIDAIDVIHGKAVLKPTQGKAHGIYATDVSKYVISIILGREWEPESVLKTNGLNSINHFDGNFVCINNGNAMEVWLSKMMDFAVTYETQSFLWQHPISFVNWLPLDPMFHNCEIIENEKVREYDNDLSSIDFEKFNSTQLFHAGIFAAYHVYPYYPDYIYLRKDYANTINSKGKKDNFLGYLNDLKQHTRGIPLVIAEFGLPSSRGISHFASFGYNQGGHSEAKQATLSLNLTRDIFESDCAGAIYFEWADEWFKHNWLVMDFEIPFYDRKLWHNMENPEQNFGILALENKKKIIDASLIDWEVDSSVNSKIKFWSDADPTYFYLSGIIPDFNFENNNLYIAIDTYSEEKGDHNLPFSNEYFENGFEFLCTFKSKDSARILVDEPYSVFTDIYNNNIPVYCSKQNQNGLFIDELMLVNRSRETVLGEKIDSIINNRSPLIHGNSSLPEFSNADWVWSDLNNIFELRLDWHLLNVCNPAKRYVLDDDVNTKAIEYAKTGGFNIYMFITDKKDNIISVYPDSDPFSATWEEWDMPSYTERLKPVYDTLKTYFHNLKAKTDIDCIPDINEDSFTITRFFNDKEGAVSLSFDNTGYSQYELALPLLQKYNFKAAFGIIPEIVEDVSGSFDVDEGIKLKRMGTPEIREIISYGNEIALQGEIRNIYPDIFTVEQRNPNFFIHHFHGDNLSYMMQDHILFLRATCNNKVLNTSYDNINYSVLSTSIDQLKLDSLLHINKNQWTIFIYHNLYKESSEIRNIDNEIVKNFFIRQDKFERQIRLIRNTDYWIATESEVFKYLKERQESKIEVNKFENYIFIRVGNNLNPNIYDQPLTIRFKTKARILKISGSVSDGIYTNRTGSILINTYPNKEVKLEILL